MSEKIIQICLVSPLPPPLGGIGRWTMLVHQWAANNPRISIAQVDISPHWRAIDDISIWKRVIGGGLQFVRDILHLARLLIRHRYDAIHLTTSGQLAVVRDLGVLFVAGLFKVPVVYHIRFGRIPQIAGANSREWKLLAQAMLKAQTVVAIDSATYHTIREHLPATQVTLIPNCINLAELPTLCTTSKLSIRTALFIGWVIPTKGIAELIEVWARLRPQGWRLQIVGPGNTSYRQSLIEQFRPDGVEFLGELSHPEAIDLMASCDLFVLPSYTEGFPNAVLEAMALGKAVVATDVGAIPEMLAEECGILVKPKDLVNLNTALQALIADDDLRTELGSRARERAIANYSTDAVLSRLWSVWRQAGDKQT